MLPKTTNLSFYPSYYNMGFFILAEWVGERTWETCLGLNRRRSRCMWIWMWSPCLSASSVLSRKYSNSFSSATQCCSVLCFLPDGPHTSWLESRMKLLKSEPAFWLQSRDRADNHGTQALFGTAAIIDIFIAFSLLYGLHSALDH